MRKSYTEISDIDWDKVEMAPITATGGYPSLYDDQAIKEYNIRRDRIISVNRKVGMGVSQYLFVSVFLVAGIAIYGQSFFMNNLIDPLSPALLSGIAVLLCGFNTIMFIKRYRRCKANKYIQPR